MKTAGDILIVDDESDIRLLIGATLRDEGFTTMEAASAMEARDLLAAKPPGLAILDIWMRDSDMDGLELLEWVKSVYPEVPVLMISGHGTVETAVQAIRNGAYDFIEKPFKEDRLLLMVQRAFEASRLERENAELRARVSEESDPSIIGVSTQIKAVRTAVERIAPTASRVLISGPNGSGKELAARCSITSLTGVIRVSLSPTARGWGRRGPMWNCSDPTVSRPAGGLSDCSNRRTREPCISTRSVTCRSKPRARSCAPLPNSASAVSAATRKSPSMCV